MVAAEDPWDIRASRIGLHAVLTQRWSPTQCLRVDREQRLALSASLPPLADKRVMDMGCGIGRITGWLAAGAIPESDHYKAGMPPAVPAQVVGVDASSAMLVRAGKCVQGGNVHFVRACAQQLPFTDKVFDVVVIVSVLQHMTDSVEFRMACQEICRAVRPGGVLVCLEGIAYEPRKSAVHASRLAVGMPVSGTKTIQRSLGQFSEAFSPWLVLDDARPLRCIADEYSVSRWTCAIEEDSW
jgi:ubiquinone/menaquinone biosynthesis C-methylase UbiE